MREIKVDKTVDVDKIFEPQSSQYSQFVDFTVEAIKEAFEQGRKEALVCNVDVEEDPNYVYTLSFYHKQWPYNLETVRDYYNHIEEYDKAIDTHVLMQEIQKSMTND